MNIEPQVKMEKNGDVRIEFPNQKSIPVPRELIPTVVEMLKSTAHKLNATLDRIAEDDEEDSNLGNIAMG